MKEKLEKKERKLEKKERKLERIERKGFSKTEIKVEPFVLET